MKANRFYALDLTVKNNRHGGFNKLSSEVNQEDLKTAFKQASDALRKKAKRHGWKYCILAGFSNEHLSKHIKGAWHIHLLVYGSPASVIGGSLKEYWCEHGYGNLRHQVLKPCYSDGKLRYNVKQSQSLLFHCHDIGALDLVNEIQEQYRGQDISEVVTELELDGDVLPKESFMTFVHLVKSGWVCNTL